MYVVDKKKLEGNQLNVFFFFTLDDGTKMHSVINAICVPRHRLQQQVVMTVTEREKRMLKINL